MDTPLGSLYVMAEGGLPRRIVLAEAECDPTRRLMGKNDLLSTDPLLRTVLTSLRLYFKGMDPPISVVESLVELSCLGRFSKRVLLETRKIQRGSVVSYGEVARRIGSPRAARAVGNALARNPFPILIPCHRVVKKCGDLGGYSQGVKWKSLLLAFEGVSVGGEGPAFPQALLLRIGHPRQTIV